MKKLYQLACALLLSCVTAGCGLLGGCASEPPTAQTEITVTPVVFSGYSQSGKTYASEKLVACFSEVLTEITGVAPTELNLVRVAANRVVSAFAAEEISEEALRASVEKLTEKRELLLALARGEESVLKGAISLVGELSALLGVERAARLAGDLAAVYCAYEADKYTQMYYDSPQLAYLLEYAHAWREREQGFLALGKENCSYALRILASASVVYGDEGVEALAPDGGEISLFLRAQGALLERLSLTEENWAFLCKLVGEGEHIRLSTLYKGGVSEGILPSLSALTSVTGRALQQVTTADAALLTVDGYAFVRALTRYFSEQDWLVVENSFAPFAGQDYSEYIVNKADYAAFCEGVSPYTFNELTACDAAEFERGVKGYLFSLSPSLAYLIFQL